VQQVREWASEKPAYEVRHFPAHVTST